LRHASESQQSFAARLIWSHASPHVLARFHFDVQAQFVVELAIETPTKKDRAQADEDGRQHCR
jgi:hypothetical protein